MAKDGQIYVQLSIEHLSRKIIAFINYFNELLSKPFTALCAQTQTKNNFESAAKQRFQNFSCGSFDR